MRIATAHLRSASPYSQSRSYKDEVPSLPRETHDAYEVRTWREKCHTVNGKDTHVIIPPMAFKMAVDAAAKQLGHQIPGKGKATYTKYFLSGCLVMEPLVLGITRDEVQCDRIYANADGVRGSGKRVWRYFPRIDSWEGNVLFHILANEITPDVFEEALTQSGAFIGIGRFRPQNGGYYGRYEVEGIKWR